MNRSVHVHFDSWWAGRTRVCATVLSETAAGFRVRFQETALGGLIRAGDIGFVPKHAVAFASSTSQGSNDADGCAPA